MTKTVSLFTVIAIIISMLDLLAMSTFFIQQRAQEVAISKVFGADNGTILRRLLGSFLIYVGISFVVATPITWYFMDLWLSDYLYRISMNPLIIVVAGFICLVFAFISVLFKVTWPPIQIRLKAL